MFQNTNQKRNEMGFDLRGETAKQNGVFDLVMHRAETKCAEADFDEGQANKSARGMPWHQEPKKDVISCDKLRGGANILRSGDFRMGKPTARYLILNQIGIRGEPPELKHLSRARKRHQPRFR